MAGGIRKNEEEVRCLEVFHSAPASSAMLLFSKKQAAALRFMSPAQKHKAQAVRPQFMLQVHPRSSAQKQRSCADSFQFRSRSFRGTAQSFASRRKVQSAPVVGR